jgi:hypothetical protein
MLRSEGRRAGGWVWIGIAAALCARAGAWRCSDGAALVVPRALDVQQSGVFVCDSLDTICSERGFANLSTASISGGDPDSSSFTCEACSTSGPVDMAYRRATPRERSAAIGLIVGLFLLGRAWICRAEEPVGGGGG